MIVVRCFFKQIVCNFCKLYRATLC